MLVLGGFPRAYRRVTDKCDELRRLIAPRSLVITSALPVLRKGRCSLWVKSGSLQTECLLWAKADMCSAHAVLFCSCCNTLIYEAGTVLHFYLLLLGQLCAFAHLLRLVTWHHLFWCSCLHLC